MMTRRVVVAALVAIGAPIAHAQERAPSGQIYRELLPFVGLDGVTIRRYLPRDSRQPRGASRPRTKTSAAGIL